MKTLVLNGSPNKNGTVASLLRDVVKGMDQRSEIEWVDVFDLKMKPCRGCMVCREENECCLPEDDAQAIGEKISAADNIIVGTPTHWGNMSSQLKLLFDRNVFVFMGKSSKGLPEPRQKGKKAMIVTSCNAPFPINVISAESRGAVRSVKHIFNYGGYKVRPSLVISGTGPGKIISERYRRKAVRLGSRM